MRVLFMGTPDFAVDTLHTLLESEHEVVGVVTQPDKPKGRSKKPAFSPVKEEALKYGVPIYQPARVKDAAFLDEIRKLKLDAAVVAAYGQILPKEFLEMPTYGCFNVHASLLPKLRGAAPIQWAVIQGDAESGVTIMQMDEGLDTGDILAMQKCRIEETETCGSLFQKLAALGGPMILEVLKEAEEGRLQPVAQDEAAHTYAKMLSKAAGRLDFSKPAQELERLVRGLNPWPSAYCFLDGKLLKVWEAKVLSDTEETENCACGTVVPAAKDTLCVKTGEGLLSLTCVQLEGKKRMQASNFLRGYPVKAGTHLGVRDLP